MGRLSSSGQNSKPDGRETIAVLRILHWTARTVRQTRCTGQIVKPGGLPSRWFSRGNGHPMCCHRVDHRCSREVDGASPRWARDGLVLGKRCGRTYRCLGATCPWSDIALREASSLRLGLRGTGLNMVPAACCAERRHQLWLTPSLLGCLWVRTSGRSQNHTKGVVNSVVQPRSDVGLRFRGVNASNVWLPELYASHAGIKQDIVPGSLRWPDPQKRRRGWSGVASRRASLPRDGMILTTLVPSFGNLPLVLTSRPEAQYRPQQKTRKTCGLRRRRRKESGVTRGNVSFREDHPSPASKGHPQIPTPPAKNTMR